MGMQDCMQAGRTCCIIFLTCYHLLDASCPEGWLSDPSSEVIRCYKLVGPGSFRECINWCREMDASLACVRDRDDNTRLSWAAADRSAWIGLSDHYSKGDFQWISKECSSSYRNWAPLEPGGDETGSCAHLRELDSRFGRWVDKGCETRLNCLCEHGLTIKDELLGRAFNDRTSQQHDGRRRRGSQQTQQTQQTYWADAEAGSLRWDHYIAESRCKTGELVDSADDCSVALEKYRQTCGGSDDHVQVTSHQGASGCQIRRGVSANLGLADFQFNAAMTYINQHFMVCYVPFINEYSVCLKAADIQQADDQHNQEESAKADSDGGVDIGWIVLLVCIAIVGICLLAVSAKMTVILFRWYSKRHQKPPPQQQRFNVRIQSVEVVVPEGATPGQMMQVRVGSRLVSANVPAGHEPGDVFSVTTQYQVQDGVQVIGSPPSEEAPVVQEGWHPAEEPMSEFRVWRS